MGIRASLPITTREGQSTGSISPAASGGDRGLSLGMLMDTLSLVIIACMYVTALELCHTYSFKLVALLFWDYSRTFRGSNSGTLVNDVWWFMDAVQHLLNCKQRSAYAKSNGRFAIMFDHSEIQT